MTYFWLIHHGGFSYGLHLVLGTSHSVSGRGPWGKYGTSTPVIGWTRYWMSPVLSSNQLLTSFPAKAISGLTQSWRLYCFINGVTSKTLPRNDIQQSSGLVWRMTSKGPKIGKEIVGWDMFHYDDTFSIIDTECTSLFYEKTRKCWRVLTMKCKWLTKRNYS